MTPPRESAMDAGSSRGKSGQPDEFSSMREIVDRVDRITLENERLFQRLIDGERRFRGLSKAVWKVQEEERRRLARDLHDGIGQTLVALRNQLERLARRAGKDDELAGGLRDSAELALLALNDTRELSRLLRPPVLDDLGLAAGLRWLARSFEERSDLEVTLRCDLGDERLDPDIETLIFRVVQEALTNVVKHARSPRAQVTLETSADDLRVLISDAGVGFDPSMAFSARADGCGLRGIRDRVELFGGNVEVVTASHEGCTVRLRVPRG
ncbi:MAG: sensor histidine kinase [Gammaproteobacteria bacterium]